MSWLRSRITAKRVEGEVSWPSVFESVLGADDRSVFVNGQPLSSGNYVVPDRQLLVRPSGVDSMQELRVPDKSLIDDDHARSVYAVMDGLVRDFLPGDGIWDDWISASPVMPGVSEKADMLPLDLEIRKNLPALIDLCRRPRHNLVLELERVPVSRAKRTPDRAAGYLAAHPEDWAQPTLTGPRPKRILAEVADESLDMFENRVVARLTDHCERYLARRIRELKRLVMLYEEVFNFGELLTSHWARQNRLYTLMAGLFDEEHKFQLARSTLKSLTTLRYRILGLTDSQLYNAISRRAAVPPDLPATNILVNDTRYRRASDLWRSGFSRVDKPQSPEQEHRRMIDSFEAFDFFVMLLVIQGCERCGASPSQDGTIRADHPLILQHPVAGTVRVSYVSELRRIEIVADSRRLLIVPVFCAVTELAADDQRVILEHLRTACEDVADETLIVYPDPLRSREEGQPCQQHALTALRHELPRNERMPYSLLAVSPWRVSSLDDVARAINWFLLAEHFAAVPPEINIPAPIATIVGKWNQTLRARSQGVYEMISPSVPQGLEADLKEPAARQSRLQEELSDLIREQKGRRGRRRSPDDRKEPQRVHQLKSEIVATSALVPQCEEVLTRLEAAKRVWRVVSQCPVCASSEVMFKERQSGFWCMCGGCKAEWGTQRCATCRSLKPCVKPHSESWARLLGQGYSPVLIAGSDLLSAPVLDAGRSVAFRCPKCGEV